MKDKNRHNPEKDVSGVFFEFETFFIEDTAVMLWPKLVCDCGLAQYSGGDDVDDGGGRHHR